MKLKCDNSHALLESQGHTVDGSEIQRSPPGMDPKPVNNGKNYQPQLVSLPDFWTINSLEKLASKLVILAGASGIHQPNKSKTNLEVWKLLYLPWEPTTPSVLWVTAHILMASNLHHSWFWGPRVFTSLNKTNWNFRDCIMFFLRLSNKSNLRINILMWEISTSQSLPASRTIVGNNELCR